MQNDLISRSALIENLREIKTVYGVPMTRHDEQVIHWVIGRIKEQPTAYSVKKVVEQLEDEKMKHFLTIANTGDKKLDFAYEKVGNALDRASEIVRNGGKE